MSDLEISSDVRSNSSSQVYYEEVLNSAAAALALDKHSHSRNSNVNNNKSNSSISSNSSSSNNNDNNKYSSTISSIINQDETFLPKNNDNFNRNNSQCNQMNPNSFATNPKSSTPKSTSTPTPTPIISMSEEDAAMLSSLPKRPIQNFPSEADRKRIIGCLAAILSMMFDHEKDGSINYTLPSSGEDGEDQDNEQGNEQGDGCNKNNSYGEGHDHSVVETPGRTQLIVQVTRGSASTSTNDNLLIFNEEQGTEDVQQDAFGNIINSNGENNNDFNGNIMQQSSRLRWNNNNNNNSNNSKNDKNCNNNGQKSRRKWRQGNQSMKRAPPNPSPSKKKISTLVEQQRYRRRRHEIYSSFLVSSAELLFLDKSHAVAFLPLLNSLLGEDQPSYSPIEIGTRDNIQEENSGTKEEEGLLRGWKEEDNELLKTPKKESVDNYSYEQSVEFETFVRSKGGYTSIKQSWDNNDLLIPFVESLTHGAGFQCLSLLLMNSLLRSQEGYDARVRHVLKKLAVVVLSHDMKESGEYEHKTGDELTKLATRKFEALENVVAIKLLKLSAAQQEQEAAASKDKDKDSTEKKGKAMQQFVRGLKVGSVGIAAGTLFAVTGGLAAPGIAAGLAASGLTATAAAASIVTTLTSTAAVTTIFGVGGGSLAAYKTHRRIKGLTEFTFNKEMRGKKSLCPNEIDGHLFSTICISGWLTDDKDFQRPWGVEPTNPPITDWSEKLMRFYTIYKKENIPRCNEILKKWKGEERQLWSVLRQKYGRDPDHLYPVQNGQQRLPISFLEVEIIDNLLKELGYAYVFREQNMASNSSDSDLLGNYNVNSFDAFSADIPPPSSMFNSEQMNTNEMSSNHNIMKSTSSDGRLLNLEEQESKHQMNNLVNQVWDFEGEYGGELLTVRWESDLLIELCDSVTDMAVDMVGTAAKEILKQTALSTLITAIAWPYGLVKAANMIDGTWTLAIERSDLAGIELARSLLESQAGHRPVTLIGFSMGARTIYSCLKELARHQLLWEEQRVRGKVEKRKRKGTKKGSDQAAIEYTREPASIVEDAILMGLPNHLSLNSWESCRCVVAGRLINCYSRRDLILSLMFQIKRLAGALKPVCGTYPVNVQGVENYDVSNFISAHSDYCRMTGHILRMINHGCPYRPSAVITIPNDFLKNVDY